jgi:DNA replication protein DnaC
LTTPLRHLHAGRADDSTDKRLASYLAPDLLVIDDYGLNPPPSTGAVGMYDVINGRYEKGSIVLTSNRAPEELAEAWGDPPRTRSIATSMVCSATPSIGS